MDRETTFLPRYQDAETTIYSDMEGESDLKKVIRSLHLKVTSQRVAILKALRSGGRHMTAQELYESVSKKDPTIGFATVYRFLRSLSDHHIVSEVRMGGLPARYEMNSKTHHDHLTCTSCGQICEFENKSIENLQTKVAQQFGYVLTHHILELYGVCSTCQAKTNKIK